MIVSSAWYPVAKMLLQMPTMLRVSAEWPDLKECYVIIIVQKASD